MAKHHFGVSSVLVGTLVIARSAGAAQPPDVVDSDNYANTAMGSYVLQNVTPSTSGGSIGYGATGVANTGAGYAALSSNTSGTYNTAFGAGALENDTTGSYNVAFGYSTLWSVTTASEDTAIGHDALEFNTTGSQNAALGTWALQQNTTGSDNAAVGYGALITNTTGANNTAFGANALSSNTTGKGNAAQGVNALYNNSTGIRNLGIGSNALYANTTGGYNIALGFDAGYNVTTGSNNIEIGTSGEASDNDTIQIGVQGTQTSTTIAGIYGAQVTGGSAVYVTSAGRLGVQGSSERFKTDIATLMPAESDRLSRLRPVTFRYKSDPTGVRQYGLIAEEVDKVYPELVIRDEKGKIQGVHYEELAPMLLGEMQRQQRINEAQAAEIRALKQRQQNQLAAQAEQIQKLQRQMAELLVERSTDQRIAQR